MKNKQNKKCGTPAGKATPSPTKVGQYLVEYRTKNKVGLHELAEKIGMRSLYQLSNIERGRAPLPHKYVKKLSKTINVHESELLMAVFVDKYPKNIVDAVLKEIK